jgi:hypothetical protein
MVSIDGMAPPIRRSLFILAALWLLWALVRMTRDVRQPL